MANFTKAQLQQIQKDLDKAIKDVAAKHGIDMRMGNGTFTDIKFTMKLHGTAKLGAGKTVEAMEFDKYKGQFGLHEMNVGDPVIVHGKNFSIAGLKPRNRKYPIIIKDGAGKQYKVSIAAAKGLKSS